MIVSDNPTRCTTTLPVDSPRLSNRPTESELMELLSLFILFYKNNIRRHMLCNYFHEHQFLLNHCSNLLSFYNSEYLNTAAATVANAVIHFLPTCIYCYSIYIVFK